MSRILERCVKTNDARNFCVVSELGKVYRLENPDAKRIRVVRVDGCFQQNEGEGRCDYLMEVKELKRVFFIELKGGGLIRACEQIYSTIIYLKAELKGYRIEARIVGSRDVTELKNTPEYKKLFREVQFNKGEIKRSTNKFYSENV
jgi:hypothetical protein